MLFRNKIKLNNKFIIIVIFTLIILFILYIFIGDKINISYIKTTNANIEWGEIPGNWFIITHREQYNNWLKKGLELPIVDFNNNFLIVSKLKIFRLYKSKIINGDCGAYDGIAIYNFISSKPNKYYIYIMDKIWLSQGIG